jgi:hypothetical protein
VSQIVCGKFQSQPTSSRLPGLPVKNKSGRREDGKESVKKVFSSYAVKNALFDAFFAVKIRNAAKNCYFYRIICGEWQFIFINFLIGPGLTGILG